MKKFLHPKTFFILILTLLLKSCYYSTEQKDTSKAQSTGRIIDTVTSSSENSDILVTLKHQLNEYLEAFTTGDSEKLIYYLYPDMFIWMKNELSKQGQSFEMKDVKSMFLETIHDIKEMQQEKKRVSNSLGLLNQLRRYMNLVIR